MTKLRSPLKTILNPMFAMTAAGLLLVGCKPAENTTPTMPTESSSSSLMMEPASSSSSALPMETSSSDQAAVSRKYADGTYSADGAYRSPAGGETVQVTLTVKDDIITSAVFKGDAVHKKSMEMQENFGSGFEEYVVGKSLDSVSVSVVNGSSLTGVGFMDAVAKIKTEAKA